MIKNYLKAYNLLLAIGWLVFLVDSVAHDFVLNSFSLWVLNVCQLAALLEVGHAGLGWVKTPFVTSLVQVFSRVFVLYWINVLHVLPPEELIEVAGINGIAMVSVAWGITEVVRYSYYFLGLLGKEVYPITWMRYTFFLVLYPLGVTGEWFIVLSKTKMGHWEFSLINIVLWLILASYFYGFPQLFGYMLQQRRKKLA